MNSPKNRAKKSETRLYEKAKASVISYHLKCTKTANGLTHFVMYGDVPNKKMPL
ncbi:MAG: hypothetical protein Q7T83_09280 [Thermodesulfovibrionales bacterium]|nr:hypothetical protein [Thermodesulfovibrionales bacterium]MDP3259556.1 hypothetical protein [Thermodesulfovibrionales bacterium]